jgi:hypothetical protein
MGENGRNGDAPAMLNNMFPKVDPNLTGIFSGGALPISNLLKLRINDLLFRLM